ncbi:DUF2064 domain-containing protein [soil metagenome]
MHITIIAKTPVPGLVKTRLCPPCTHEQAAAIARAGMLDTIEAIDGAFQVARDATRTLLLDGDVETWMPANWQVEPQRGDGLLERIRNGFYDLGPGIIVGMETPHVAALLPDAIDHLLAGRNLLGLADDGGYWAIGLCARAAAQVDEVFGAIEMSTSTTGEQQLRRLQALGSETVLLPHARDLDDYADLCAIAESDRGGRLGDLARQIVNLIDAELHERS